MNKEQFNKFAGSFRTDHGFNVVCVDDHGSIIHGKGIQTDCSCQGNSDAIRLRAARQTLTFGEPIINLCCENGYALWAIPITDNNRMTGAIVVQGIDLEAGAPDLPARVDGAAKALLQKCIISNLTNASLMEQARENARRERDRFLSIEAAKENWEHDELRTAYIRNEPELLTAIREGDTQEARSILNRILTSIYAVSGQDMELLKSCILELIVMMNRAAVEAGGDASLVLGNQYRSLADLSSISDEEDLAIWVRNILEILISNIHKGGRYPHYMVLNKALRYMEANLNEPLKRDHVARVAGMSPSHFSKVMAEHMGRSFSELLTLMRINRARMLISSTNYNLTAIAMECGFFDQSHFSRTFRKVTGLSPGAYRKEQAAR